MDAVEVRSDHGRRALGQLRDRGDSCPIVVSPYGSWLLLVRSGGELREELATRVRLHAADAWMPLPPTSCADVPYRWRVTPTNCSWRLGDPGWVQESLLDVLPDWDAAESRVSNVD